MWAETHCLFSTLCQLRITLTAYSVQSLQVNQSFFSSWPGRPVGRGRGWPGWWCEPNPSDKHRHRHSATSDLTEHDYKPLGLTLGHANKHLSPLSVWTCTLLRSAESWLSLQLFGNKMIWPTEWFDWRNKWLRYDEGCVDDKISHPLSSDVGGRGNLVIFYREARDCITSSQKCDWLPAWKSSVTRRLSSSDTFCSASRHSSLKANQPKSPILCCLLFIDVCIILLWQLTL